MVLRDDGVEVLRGSIDGDREAGRSAAEGGGGCKAIELFSVSWTVWGSGMSDRLLSLCASVGLTVRAPKPDVCCGRAEIRFPEVPEGVVARDLTVRGDRGAEAEALCCSTERLLLSAEAVAVLIRDGGGCESVLSLAAREAVMFRDVSV